MTDPTCWNCAHAKLDHEHDGCVVGVEGVRCGCEEYNEAPWRQEINIRAHDVEELNEVARIVTNGSERHPLFSVRYGVACAVLESQWLHDRLAAACESVHPVPPTVSEAENCHRCGGPNVLWAAASPLWNYVMRGNEINGTPIFGDMVCVSCFITLAGEAGLKGSWRLTLDPEPDGLIYQTPSGRVWDQEQFLWV